MNGQTTFANLRNVLATLYTDETSARRVAADAGLNVGHIAFSNQAVNNWDAILNQALKQQRINDLIDLVVKPEEYGNNQKLWEACDAFRNTEMDARERSKTAEIYNQVYPKFLIEKLNLHSPVSWVSIATFVVNVAAWQWSNLRFFDLVNNFWGAMILSILGLIFTGWWVWHVLQRSLRSSIKWGKEDIPSLSIFVLVIATSILTNVNLTYIRIEKVAQFERQPEEAYILLEITSMDKYLVSGKATTNYLVGDDLVVYDEISPNIELPIALLRVVSKNPQSLMAQAILVHPEKSILPNFRVDRNVDQLSTSELVPSPNDSIGYFLAKGRIRLRPGSEDAKKDVLVQAFEPQLIDDAIADYLPTSPQVIMRIKAIGVRGSIAEVELVAGDWPNTGALVFVTSPSPAEPISTPSALPTIILDKPKPPEEIKTPLKGGVLNLHVPAGTNLRATIGGQGKVTTLEIVSENGNAILTVELITEEWPEPQAVIMMPEGTSE